MGLRLHIHARPRSEESTEVLVTPNTTSHDLIQILRIQSPILQDNQFGLMISNIRNKCRWIEEYEELGKIIINEYDTIFIQPYEKLITLELPGSQRVKVKVNVRIKLEKVVYELCHRFHIWPYEIWGAFMDARGENVMLLPNESISEEAPDIEKIYLKQYLFPRNLNPEFLSPSRLYILQYRQMILDNQFGETQNDKIVLKGKDWYNRRNFKSKIPISEDEKKKELHCIFSLQTFGQTSFQLRFHDTVGDERYHTIERIVKLIISHSAIIVCNAENEGESMYRPFSTIKNVGVRDGLVRITFADDQEWHLTSHRYSEIACILCNLMNKHNFINPPAEFADVALVLPESIQVMHLETFSLPNKLYSTEELIRANMISLAENYIKFATANMNEELDENYLMAENGLNSSLEELLNALKVKNPSLNAVEIVTSISDDINNINTENIGESQKELKEIEKKILRMNEIFFKNDSKELFNSIQNAIQRMHSELTRTKASDSESNSSKVNTSNTICQNHIDALRFVTFDEINDESYSSIKIDEKENELQNNQNDISQLNDSKMNQIIISSEYYYDISSDSSEYSKRNSTPVKINKMNNINSTSPASSSNKYIDEIENINDFLKNSSINDNSLSIHTENVVKMQDPEIEVDFHKEIETNDGKERKQNGKSHCYDSKINRKLSFSSDSYDSSDEFTLAFPKENQQDTRSQTTVKISQRIEINRSEMNISIEQYEKDNILKQYSQEQKENSEKLESTNLSSKNEKDEKMSDNESSDFEINSPLMGVKSHRQKSNHTLAIFTPTKELYKHKRNPSFYVEEPSEEPSLENTAPAIYQNTNMENIKMVNCNNQNMFMTKKINQDSKSDNRMVYSNGIINKNVDMNVHNINGDQMKREHQCSEISLEKANAQLPQQSQQFAYPHQSVYHQSSQSIYAQQGIYYPLQQQQTTGSMCQTQQIPPIFPQQGIPVPYFPQMPQSYSQVLPTYQPSPQMYSPSPLGSPNCHIEANPNIIVNVTPERKKNKKKSRKNSIKECSSSDSSESSYDLSDCSEISLNSDDTPTINELIECIQTVTQKIALDSTDWKSAHSEMSSLLQFMKKLSTTNIRKEARKDFKRLITKGNAIIKQIPKKKQVYDSFAQSVEKLLILDFEEKLKEIQSYKLKSTNCKTNLEATSYPDLELAYEKLQTSLQSFQQMNHTNSSKG